ncbi:MAG: GHKL domain-containing protein [Spirochaetia bacterium]|nr:GHKL domain-containing protein [Spirochaetia bacterium]
MHNFVKRALEKLEQLDIIQIEQLIKREDSYISILEQVLDNLAQGIILLDNRKRLVYINKVAKLLPPIIRKKTYEGDSIYSIIEDKNVIAYIQAELTKIGYNEEENEFNYQWGEEIRTILLNVIKLTDEKEIDENGFLLVFKDITIQKRNETRLRRSENLASMTTMAAGVAHEIKNPLAAMSIHLQLLNKAFEKKQTLTIDDASRYINVLSEEIERLNSIVVDFLFAVRPMDTKLKLTSVSRAINEICNFIEPELKENHVKLIRDIKSTPKVELDTNLFRQALLNIIKNAMNAIDKKGTINICVKLRGDEVVIVVKDSGKGMDQNTVNKIFEPYFTTKASGTGLGLTVVYKVIKEHKGDIRVKSELDKGSEFTITLPVPHSERLAIDDSRESFDE